MQRWRTLLSVAWFIWILDLATKAWAVSQLAHREPVKVIGTFFQLNFVRNSGAAFSFATNATLFLSLFGIIVLIVIIYFAPQITSKGWSVVLGLVMGGILGNLMDRIFREPGFLRGHVIDWMQLPNWPIFNIADSAIVCAAVLSVVLTGRNISPITKKNIRP
ncbi:MAG: signal peptidase II [Actinomycetales bacterium]|nr:MAG: signal peptidase II [Actinomycetales bacterium]